MLFDEKNPDRDPTETEPRTMRAWGTSLLYNDRTNTANRQPSDTRPRNTMTTRYSSLLLFVIRSIILCASCIYCFKPAIFGGSF